MEISGPVGIMGQVSKLRQLNTSTRQQIASLRNQVQDVRGSVDQIKRAADPVAATFAEAMSFALDFHRRRKAL